MLSKEELIGMVNEEVIFRGFSRNNVSINNELNSNQLTDWYGMYFVMPYIGKQCRLLGLDEDGIIQCEFELCDMQGNITDEGLISIEITFEFAEYSNGILDYDPVFERIEQDIIPINNIPLNNVSLQNNIIENYQTSNEYFS